MVGFLILLMVLSPVVGWVFLMMVRERLSVAAIYENPRRARLLYGLRMPLWAWVMLPPLLAYVLMPVVMLLSRQSLKEGFAHAAEAREQARAVVMEGPKSKEEIQQGLELRSMKAELEQLREKRAAYEGSPEFQTRKAQAAELRRGADAALQAGAPEAMRLKFQAEGAEQNLKTDLLATQIRSREASIHLKEIGVHGFSEQRSIRANQVARKVGVEETPALVKAMMAIQMLLPLGLFIGLVSLYLAHKRYKRTEGIHGGARWAKWREIITDKNPRFLFPVWAAYNGTPRRWQLWERFLGGVGLNIVAQPDGDAVNSHFLVLGGTGSGKGFGVFNHILATSRVPVIYQDVKGECPMFDHPKRREAIRWGCAAENSWPSMRWDPLKECMDDPNPYDALKALAGGLIQEKQDGGGSDSAWVGQAARAVLPHLLSSGKFRSLGAFADFVWDVPLPEVIEAVQEVTESEKDVQDAIRRSPRGLMHSMEGKNSSNYIALELQAQLDSFRVGWGREVTSGMDFTLDDLINKGGYILSAEGQEENRKPLKIMWALLLRRLMRSGVPRPCVVLMDEALAAGKIPHILDALLTLRNREVSIWMAFQSASALMKLYGQDEGRAVMDAFGNRVVLLHGINPNDAKELSELVGNWSQKKDSTINVGVGMTGPSIGIQSGGNQETAIPLLPVTEIMSRSRSMDERWAVLSMREAAKKGNPILCRLVGAENLTRKPTQEEVKRDLRRWRVNPQTAAMPHALDQVPCGSCSRLNPINHPVCEGCGAVLGA